MTRTRLALVLAAAVFACAVPTPGEAQVPRHVTWLALGDSHAAGEGVDDARDEPGSKCQRTNAAHGPAAATQLGPQATVDVVRFPACTGATARSNAIAGPDKDADRQLAGLPAGETFDVISLTFGGNDVGFADTMARCLGGAAASYGAGAALGPVGLVVVNLSSGFCKIDEPATTAKIQALQADLTALYGKAVARLRAGGRVYVLGYPHLFAPSATWPAWVRATACSGIKAKDADTISRLTDVLNTTVQTAVGTAGPSVAYVATADLYDKHGLCGPGQDWINGFPTLDGNENRGSVLEQLSPSFHPTRAGQAAVAQRLATQVRMGL